MNLYQNCYDLIHQYVYGNMDLTAHMDLVATLISTIAVVFCIALPFAIVWNVVKRIANI